MKAVFVDLLNLYNDLHGIYSLSACLKKNGIETDYIGTRKFSRALSKIKQYQPDVVLYSAFSTNISLYMRFDEDLKKQMKVVSVIGGPGPTLDWQVLAGSTINAICVGEGEDALVKFLKNGLCPVKNIFLNGDAFPKEFFKLVDLDGLPFPDREVVYRRDSLLKNSPSKQFFSGRGCPYQCSYCFNHQFREMFKDCGSFLRRKSVSYLLDEIKDVRRKYVLSDVVFNDDLFILDKNWFLEFAARFPREIGLPYTCNVRANLLDEEIVKALKGSNCRGVNWSIETGDEKIRNEVLKRQMTDAQILRAGDLLRKYKLRFRTGNILGLPGESFEQMNKTVEMNIQVKPYVGLANIFVPFPGLKLTEYAVEQGFSHAVSTKDLPKDYFSASMLKLSYQEKNQIYKRFCLFPFFVNWPGLFYNKKIREWLLKLPKFVLRPLYELMYTFKLSRFCLPKISLFQIGRMAIRHLKNI